MGKGPGAPNLLWELPLCLLLLSVGTLLQVTHAHLLPENILPSHPHLLFPLPPSLSFNLSHLPTGRRWMGKNPQDTSVWVSEGLPGQSPSWSSLSPSQTACTNAPPLTCRPATEKPAICKVKGVALLDASNTQENVDPIQLHIVRPHTRVTCQRAN